MPFLEKIYGPDDNHDYIKIQAKKLSKFDAYPFIYLRAHIDKEPA